MTKIIVNKDIEKLSNDAAGIIAGAIKKIVDEKGQAVFGIVGGRSVSGVFYSLKKKDIPWEKVHIFMVDERLVPIDDKESNYRLAEEKLIRELVAKAILPKANVHPFIMDKDKEDNGISDYTKELKLLGGVYDIILLSSGEDGHIGALYPNHHSIKDGSEFFIILHDSPKSPSDRMTATKNLIQKSKTAVIMFLGEAKREAKNKCMDDNEDIITCPAKIVERIHDSYMLTDIV